MRRLLVFASLVAVPCACSNSGETGTAGDADSVSKYTQTWAKSYSATSCDEWNSQMSVGQQFAAAADMLTGARNNGDGGSGLPGDSLISQFQGGVTTDCVVPASNVAEIGAALYLTERDTFAP